ncbi:hypothetical protein WDW89_10245 [Deltaproteobacteria bacterium TL4]
MALSTHIIVDSGNNKGVHFFWRLCETEILKHLAPVTVSVTMPGMPVAQLIREVIEDGWKKIILIGTVQTMNAGIHVVMQCTSDLRETLELGFWPLTPVELSSGICSSGQIFAKALQVFKTGHVYPLDLVKVTYDANQFQSLYFWKECYITSPSPPTPFTLRMDEHSECVEQSKRYCVKLHQGRLHSLRMDPEELKHSDKLLIQIAPNPQQWNLARRYWNRFFLLEPHDLILTESCGTLECWTTQSTLELRICERVEQVQKVALEIHRNALPLIVPMMPARFKEPQKTRLALKSNGVIVTKTTVSRPPLSCNKKTKASE